MDGYPGNTACNSGTFIGQSLHQSPPCTRDVVGASPSAATSTITYSMTWFADRNLEHSTGLEIALHDGRSTITYSITRLAVHGSANLPVRQVLNSEVIGPTIVLHRLWHSEVSSGLAICVPWNSLHRMDVMPAIAPVRWAQVHKQDLSLERFVDRRALHS